VAELAHKTGAFGETELLGHEDEFRTRITCSQMVLHSRAPVWTGVTGEVLPGVYQEGGSLTCLREGIILREAGDEGEFLVTSAIPRPGTRVCPGVPLARIISRRPALEPSLSKLTQRARDAATAVHQNFDLQPLSQTPTPHPEAGREGSS